MLHSKHLNLITLNKTLFLGFFFSSLTMLSGTASAVTDLSIAGNINLSSINPSNNITQTGRFSTIQGGLTTNTDFDHQGITAGSNPLIGTLTTIGDGFSATTDLDASYDGAYSYIANLVINFTNNSATDDYKVSLNINFNHTVNADVDAYAQSTLDPEIDTFDIPGASSDIVSDNFFGDEKNGSSLPTLGDTINDNGNQNFDLTLLAGASHQLTTDWGWEGEVFDPTGASTVDFFGEVKITNIVNLTTIPLPGAMLFFVSSLLGMGFMSRLRNTNP